MLESKTESPDEVPQRKNTNNSECSGDNRDSNLLDNSIQSEIYERQRNYYLPSEPLGFNYFEKIFYIFKYGNIPFHVHITLPIYIIATLIFSIFHSQPLSWFTLILLLLIFHIIFIFLQIFFSLYIANKFDAQIHRILIWPFGFIGYATDYKQWSHFLIVEYAAPTVHIMLFAIFWGIAVILGVANWRFVSPINVYFGQNVLNGIWVNNIITASLHICIPVYSMKTCRIWITYLYRKRRHREVAQLILLPSGFITVLLLIFGIVDAQPLPLFLSVWAIYQTFLLYDGNRKNLAAKLPLFQLLEDRTHKTDKSRDVGQSNQEQIVEDLGHEIQITTKENIIVEVEDVDVEDFDVVTGKVEAANKRKKMSTLDENDEYEPNIKHIDMNEAIEIEVIQEIETEHNEENKEHVQDLLHVNKENLQQNDFVNVTTES